MVSVVITTFNSAGVLERCLESVFQQDYPSIEVIVVDNASSDGTKDILKPSESRARIFCNDHNTGFSSGMNQGIAQARGGWFLSLNPDVILNPDFISKLIVAAKLDSRIGTVCGKLLRWKPGQNPERTQVIDSTGIYFLRNLRHLDRGAEEIDNGQYDRPGYVIGATGAAALYRRAMVEDISPEGEFFDEDFFAYREDADVAWRAQWMGWTCLYTPLAVGWHVRRVTPSRFKELTDLINRHSIKNRFLMRAKNITLRLYLRLLIPVTIRDALILGYCVVFKRTLLSGLSYAWASRESVWRKRKWIQSRRRIPDKELARWFLDGPRSFSYPTHAIAAGPEEHSAHHPEP